MGASSCHNPIRSKFITHEAQSKQKKTTFFNEHE